MLGFGLLAQDVDTIPNWYLLEPVGPQAEGSQYIRARRIDIKHFVHRSGK